MSWEEGFCPSVTVPQHCSTEFYLQLALSFWYSLQSRRHHANIAKADLYQRSRRRFVLPNKSRQHACSSQAIRASRSSMQQNFELAKKAVDASL